MGSSDLAAYHRAVDYLAEMYWRPVYVYFRRKWNLTNEDAKDLTQEFFASVIEKESLENYSPTRGKFRSYIMVSLNNLVRMQRRGASSQKRGGPWTHSSIEMAPGIEIPTEGTPEQAFNQEWIQTLLRCALSELEHEYRHLDRDKAFELLMLHDIEHPRDADLSYQALAKRFEISEGDVANYLYRARHSLRMHVLQLIRETVSTEADVASEIKELFKSWPW